MSEKSLISTKSLQEILSNAVDSFFVDGSSVDYSADSGTLKVEIWMDHFGVCLFVKQKCKSPADDVVKMANIANQHLEAISTEMASAGLLPAEERPIFVPPEYAFLFREFDQQKLTCAAYS